MDRITPLIKIAPSSEEVADFKDEVEKKHYTFLDLFNDQIDELAELRSFGHDKSHQELLEEYSSNACSLVTFPWSRTAIKILNQDDFWELLTSRNKNLITKEEQANFRSTKLAVAGLSVGSNIVSTIVMQGGSQSIAIADGDTLATSNLNRVSSNLTQVGVPKTEVLARKIFEVNPYLKVECFSNGLTEENIRDFVKNADIIFDEIDSLHLKLELRLLSKEYRKPLIMITDNGDNVMVDIERYDTDTDLIPFHGLISSEDIELIRTKKTGLSPSDRVVLSLKIVQPHNAVPRMQESLLQVGKTLKTWPQLGTASQLAGSVGAYITRRIANNLPLQSGRSHVSIDAVLIPGYDNNDSKEERRLQTERFMSSLPPA